ncbi:O-antigen ligase family protein [Flavobacterium sp.]|uniref:O-antigen ligase family protein n=1 Tax=Flavobacterium sp. TaxID=239 RepID=UPI0039E3762E
MEHTSNYLKTVLLNLRQESKEHPTLLLIALSLLTIPLPYVCNSISVILLVGTTLITAKKRNVHLETRLLLPIGLFVLMMVSLLWSVDFRVSVKALQKGIPLLLVPLCFMIFPALDCLQKQKILRYFSYGMVGFTLFWLIKALVRFVAGQDSSVFFYHELVTEDVNAIHVSVYITVSIFYFLTRGSKSNFDKMAVVLLVVFLVQLSSKNILLVFLLLAGIYSFRLFRSKNRQLLLWGILVTLLASAAFMGKIKDRFLIEFNSNTRQDTVNTEVGNNFNKVYNVTIWEAWNQETFSDNDYFPGAAFRVYQIRIFKELLSEDSIFFTGYGLNAVDEKIKEKGRQHRVFSGNETHDGYQNKNFHNQYVQVFAELGIFGLLLLVVMLGINLKNALQTKDFIHISFAILMISLFLTESFLSRQRGIIFFTVMYCLFNSGIRFTAAEKE